MSAAVLLDFKQRPYHPLRKQNEHESKRNTSSYQEQEKLLANKNSNKKVRWEAVVKSTKEKTGQNDVVWLARRLYILHERIWLAAPA